MASPLRLNTIRNEEQFYHPPLLQQAQPRMIMMPQGAGSADSTGVQYPDGFPPSTDGLQPEYLPGDKGLIDLIDRNLAQPDVSSQPPMKGLQLASNTGGGGGSSDFNWLTAIGAGLQSAGAAHFGNYNVPQQYFQMKQQADMRKEMFAQQQAQAEEAKRQHNMLMTEKLIQTGNLDALNAFGKEFAPAGLIGSAMAQKDLAEVPSLVKGGYLDQTFVESIFDKDPSKRPTPGQIKAHVDFAKEMFKEDYKAQVKNSALDKALAIPAEKRTPGQQRLVDDHQAELGVKQSTAELHQAQALKALRPDDENKDHSVLGRVGQLMFGKSWPELDQGEKAMAYQKWREDETLAASQKSQASQMAQVSVPDKLPLTHVEKIMDDIQAVQHVENLKSMFDADKMGRIRGTIGGVAEWAGLLGTDESTLRAEVATMKNAIIKARSGLAVTEAEGKRIDKETPNMTDSPTIFAAKLKLTEKNLRALSNKRRQLYKQAGYDISHIAPLEGVEGVAGGTAPPQAEAPSAKKYGSLDEWKKAHGY